MTSPGQIVDLIMGISPFGEPDARLATAVSRAGGLGVLDLGAGDRRAREALERLRRWSTGPFGVRVSSRCRLLAPDCLPAPSHGGPSTVMLGVGSAWRVGEVAAPHRVLVEVTGPDEALEAVEAGAHGLVARGCESGGRVGDLSTFVLVQRLLADPGVTVPVWACGGIGPRTAAAAVVGGAAGVVLDTQLALLAESDLAEETAAAIRPMDGSETVLVAGHRVLMNRGPHTPGAEDSPAQSLPVGQDGFLAARFAELWGDTARAVRGVRTAVRNAIVDDSAARALRSGSPMSRALGTRLPIAQGPMTRVSDQARFAAAVAEEGALPFIALALAGPEQTRSMLEQTRAALGERPWGVGVLGFAPEETRSAQLEAVRELRPSHAIIAGGRPSQAEALDRVGVRTFLHVPSPGLLRQFLNAGARRFVFEGSECGGHVGPRTSFTLWEAQSAVLEDFLDSADEGTADRLEVFFAGGIHDERSSAMVAALAAPLTARGAAVGVLMGTAYLFTREAVEHAAVTARFQSQVMRATSTALLETAPGHATRCVPSPFTDAFPRVREEMRGRGLTGRELWEGLERLNVGRLRIASKGVERRGEELVGVDEGRRLAEGMFMAGDVAVLRSATTTIRDLHRSAAPGAADHFGQRAAALREQWGIRPAAPADDAEAPAALDVAVVGMACVFPQAADLAEFWANTLRGTDTITEVPAERWDPAVHWSAEGGGATASKWGGFLPGIAFDPLRYGIPPASLGSIEPVQLLALEVARRALEDAGHGGCAAGFDRSRTSVVFGAEAGSDLSQATGLRPALRSYFGRVPEGLDEQLPTLTEDSFPGMLANVISGRIANRLDLGGANYTVDAACASSLAAVDVACKELTAGTSDLVLCGGADLHNGINDYVLFSSVHALSPTGRCRAFDSEADGIALGEGVACVVLKRLADAERDGDRIYGVIKGVGSSSDGRSLGLTAPSPRGQRAALERAYRNAGVCPADVGLVEAHGTGTVVGDRTELAVLTEVFTEAGAAAGGCALGSVKSQIGHTKCAAGLAGLIRTAMALHTGVKPPTSQLRQPNPAWRPRTSPFAFHTEASPWAAPPAQRVAGVSAFGFGGTNFHVVLAAHDKAAPVPHGFDEWPAELFLFRGADHAAARRSMEKTLALLEADGTGATPWRLRDLAHAASCDGGTGRHPVQAAVVAGDLEGLGRRLRQALAGEHDPGSGVHLAGPAAAGDAFRPGEGGIAFLFPGQGSQRPGMLAEYFVAFPELQHYLELGGACAEALHPPAAFGSSGQDEQRSRIMDTRVAQPALGMVGLAVHDLLVRAGVRPDLAAGHSYGELVALCAAGAIGPRSLLELSAERAEAILGATGRDPGAMAAVPAGAEDIERALREADLDGRVVLANRNAPLQNVLSGPTEALDEAVRVLRAAGYGAKRLPVACAFHSPLVSGAGGRFAKALRTTPVRTPEVPVWSNRTAEVYPREPDAVRAELAAQIGAPVRFAEQIEAMYRAGARVFVEAGPGTVLTRLVESVLGDRPHRAAACEPRPGSGLRGFLDALAHLAVSGVPVRTAWMFRGRDTVDASRAARPSTPGWTVDGHLVRTADGRLLPGALAPARRIAEADVVRSHPSDGGRADREALVSEFLRTGREMVAAQRDVLLTYLGAAPDSGTGSPPVVEVGERTRPLPVESLPASPVESSSPGLAGEAAAAARPSGADTAPVAPAAVTQADVLRSVLEIIGERTGYPVDMIEPDLDLEADLSIDSIKRAEIAGELAARLGVGSDMGAAGLGDGELEELSRARTAAEVSGWLTARLTAPAEPPAPSPPPAAAGAPAGAPAGGAAGAPAGAASSLAGSSAVGRAALPERAQAPLRFRMLPVPLGPAGDPVELPSVVAGKRFAL
ncbi:type I polyketide synthase, partial [Wenjunlia tyrosinilytica]|uniref:type I polyketide synthase n=1 Tax=Wenjunlia tyrosinilytica TaxID=1544741 RepID=UPI00166F643A